MRIFVLICFMQSLTAMGLEISDGQSLSDDRALLDGLDRVLMDARKAKAAKPKNAQTDQLKIQQSMDLQNQAGEEDDVVPIDLELNQ